MISIVYVVGDKSWVVVLPVIPGSAVKGKMNEMYRTLVLGGLENPNNVAKRDQGFTAMVMDSSQRPVYVYTQNAATDSYDMSMEFCCDLNMELLPGFGQVRPHAQLSGG